MEPVYRTVVGVFLGAFKLRGWDVRIAGGEHIPQHGGAVIATNHVSYLDFVFVGAGVRAATRDKRLVRFAAKKEAFDHRLSGPLMRAMRHIPVDRQGNPAAAIDESVRLLRAGELVGMFPESTISPSYEPLPAKTGTVRMAQEAGVPIVPGAVWGCQRLFPKGRKRDLRRDVVVTVAFGEPLHPTSDGDPEVATKAMMERIGALVRTAQDSYPQAPATGEEAWWLPARLGGTAPSPEEGARMVAEAAARRRERQAASELSSSD